MNVSLDPATLACVAAGAFGAVVAAVTILYAVKAVHPMILCGSVLMAVGFFGMSMALDGPPSFCGHNPVGYADRLAHWENTRFKVKVPFALWPVFLVVVVAGSALVIYRWNRWLGESESKKGQ